MAFEFDFDSGFVTRYRTGVISLKKTNNHVSVKITATDDGQLIYRILTADNIDLDNLQYQEITKNIKTTLTYPNKVLLLEVYGTTGSTITNYEVDYND
jgi:hypothetical protein